MRYDKVFFQRHQVEIPNKITIFTYLQKWIEHYQQLRRKKPSRADLRHWAEATADDPAVLMRAVIHSIREDKKALELHPEDQARLYKKYLEREGHVALPSLSLVEEVGL